MSMLGFSYLCCKLKRYDRYSGVWNLGNLQMSIAWLWSLDSISLAKFTVLLFSDFGGFFFLFKKNNYSTVKLVCLPLF